MVFLALSAYGLAKNVICPLLNTGKKNKFSRTMVADNSSYYLVLHSQFSKLTSKETNLMAMHKDDAKILGFVILSFMLAGIGGVALAIGLVIAAGR